MKEKTKAIETKISKIGLPSTGNRTFAKVVSEQSTKLNTEQATEIKELKTKIDDLLDVVKNLIKLITAQQTNNALSNSPGRDTLLSETLKNLSKSLLKIDNNCHENSCQ